MSQEAELVLWVEELKPWWKPSRTEEMLKCSLYGYLGADGICKILQFGEDTVIQHQLCSFYNQGHQILADILEKR